MSTEVSESASHSIETISDQSLTAQLASTGITREEAMTLDNLDKNGRNSLRDADSQNIPFSQTTGNSADNLKGRQSVAKDLMHPTQEALLFLSQLVDADFQSLLFDDTLVTVSDTGREVGEFKVKVAATTHRGRAALVVHASSDGVVDGVECGTSIVAYVSPSRLETLEQRHHEYVKLANHPLDRKTVLVKEKDGYCIDRTVTQGEDVQETSQVLQVSEADGFITEGSNLLLQRLLVQKGLPDNFRLQCLDSELQMCGLTYMALQGRKQVIAETEVEMSGIERKIISPSDLPTSWHSYFMKDGHLTSRVQVGSPVMMRLTRLPASVDVENAYVKPTFDKQSLKWEDDIELASKFLDRKEALRSDHASYVRARPELRALLADFAQCLLLRRPADAIAFAAEHFAPFGAAGRPGTALPSSDDPVPFPFNRTNSKIQFFSKAT